MLPQSLFVAYTRFEIIARASNTRGAYNACTRVLYRCARGKIIAKCRDNAYTGSQFDTVHGETNLSCRGLRVYACACLLRDFDTDPDELPETRRGKYRRGGDGDGNSKIRTPRLRNILSRQSFHACFCYICIYIFRYLYIQFYCRLRKRKRREEKKKEIYKIFHDGKDCRSGTIDTDKLTEPKLLLIS